MLTVVVSTIGGVFYMSKLIRGENDLKTLMPDLMEDWDWDLNEKDPSTLMLGSNYYAHWKCHVCGHRWVSRLDSRTKCLHGCPVCAKKWGILYTR